MWKGLRVLVTGAASFIGSHLVEALIDRGAEVIGVDDLSSGKLANLDDAFKKANFTMKIGDLFEKATRDFVFGLRPDVMFHLAAVHGGRGYVDQQGAIISTNFALDNLCFEAARKALVKRIIYASSGCVYPNWMQMIAEEKLYLIEGMVPKIDQEYMVNWDEMPIEEPKSYAADGIYGWAKLMAEFTLQAYHKTYGIDTACCRYFTAYGPRAKEDHAVMAMIARAYTKQEPFEIWGDGTQIRNWTYIDDIVNGTLLVAENVTDGRGVNVGTMERTSVNDAAVVICRHFNHVAPINYLTDKPTGPMNRVADNQFIKSYGYGEFVSFSEGIAKTIEWYIKTKTPEQAKSILEEGSLIDGRSR